MHILKTIILLLLLCEDMLWLMGLWYIWFGNILQYTHIHRYELKHNIRVLDGYFLFLNIVATVSNILVFFSENIPSSLCLYLSEFLFVDILKLFYNMIHVFSNLSHSILIFVLLHIQTTLLFYGYMFLRSEK